MLSASSSCSRSDSSCRRYSRRARSSSISPDRPNRRAASALAAPMRSSTWISWPGAAPGAPASACRGCRAAGKSRPSHSHTHTSPSRASRKYRLPAARPGFRPGRPRRATVSEGLRQRGAPAANRDPRFEMPQPNSRAIVSASSSSAALRGAPRRRAAGPDPLERDAGDPGTRIHATRGCQRRGEVLVGDLAASERGREMASPSVIGPIQRSPSMPQCPHRSW